VVGSSDEVGEAAVARGSPSVKASFLIFSSVAPAVGRTTRIGAYNRVEQAWSDDPPHAQDGRESAADLHTLLDRAGEDGPFVLAGHSPGGSYAMTYAAQYPEQVAGMVLLDPSDPYRSTGHDSADDDTLAAIAVLRSLARLSIGRLGPASAWSSLYQPSAGQVQAFAATARGWRNQRDEYAAMPALDAQAQAADLPREHAARRPHHDRVRPRVGPHRRPRPDGCAVRQQQPPRWAPLTTSCRPSTPERPFQ
jgi:pimeloyl-ACP methyl ester carboxylesterase